MVAYVMGSMWWMTWRVPVHYVVDDVVSTVPGQYACVVVI